MTKMVNYAVWHHREPRWTMKGMVKLLLIMTVVQNTTADLSTLLQLKSTSVIERPERAALEPPTVTSLKPPDRSKGGRGAGGIFVQSEQSGSHIPPVVASRSPSSSSFSRNYNSRYLHLNPPLYQPSAPVATASSGSRSGHQGEIIEEHLSSKTHPSVPAQSPPVNGTSVSIPHESSWFPPVSYAPPPPRRSHSSSMSPVANNYPRDPRVHVGTTRHVPAHPNGGGGVWGNAAGGMWRETERHPSHHEEDHIAYGHTISEDSLRTDTFGHQISEDLSHLRSIYSPRRENSRFSHGLIPGNNHHHELNINDNYHVDEDFQEALKPYDSSSERKLFPNLSGNDDIAPSAFGSSVHNGKTHKSQVTPSRNKSDADSEKSQRPLTLYEILHMLKMSTLDEFKEFLKSKGLKFSQVRDYLNEGASKEMFLNYFDKPDLINYDSTLLFTNESSNPDRTDSIVFPSGSSPHEDTQDFNEDDDTEESNKRNRRKGKNKKKKRKNKGRNRNRNRNLTDRQTSSQFSYTTIMFPTDAENTERQFSGIDEASTISPTTPLYPTTAQMMPEQNIRKLSITPTTSFQPTKSTLLLNSSEVIVMGEVPLPVSVPPLLTLWSQSSLDSLTTHSTLTTKATRKMVLIPTTITSPTLTHEDNDSLSGSPSAVGKAPRVTPLPSPKGPRTGSLTLPPTSKPSQVSIISFTVMEVPRQAIPKETVLEDITPYMKKNVEPQETYPKRVYSSPKLFPSVTPKRVNDDPLVRTPYKREESKDSYTFPVKGFMIITGIMGALAVFTLVVLISYAIIKCSKQPVVNNYQVSEQAK